MIQILKDMGITEYEPRVINQMLEFTYSEWLHTFAVVDIILPWQGFVFFHDPDCLLSLFAAVTREIPLSEIKVSFVFLNCEPFSSQAAHIRFAWLLILSTGYVTTIIEDAKIYATHAKKSTVDADDIKLAIQCRMDQSFTSPPPRDVSPQEYSLW